MLHKLTSISINDSAAVNYLIILSNQQIRTKILHNTICYAILLFQHNHIFSQGPRSHPHPQLPYTGSDLSYALCVSLAYRPSAPRALPKWMGLKTHGKRQQKPLPCSNDNIYRIWNDRARHGCWEVCCCRASCMPSMAIATNGNGWSGPMKHRWCVFVALFFSFFFRMFVVPIVRFHSQIAR